MKMTRLADAKPYEAPGHYDMRALRLHNKDDVTNGEITLGLSYFLPGGGAAYGKAPIELIYYIIDGEMTIKTDEETYILQAGDSIHFAVGDGREPVNNTNRPASMLVVAVAPKTN
jgi:quercetin dioxygenase-like cupin family protein